MNLRTLLIMLLTLIPVRGNAQFRPITQPAPLRLHKVFSANETFNIPTDVKRILIKTWGAGGGGGGAGLNGATDIAGGNGGNGGFASAIVPVNFNDLIEVQVGGSGLKGKRLNNVGFGGSGGGDTYVKVEGITAIHTAAGGGGGGGDSISANGGAGGNGGGPTAGDNGTNGTGTAGGGAGAVNQTTAVATQGTRTTMATCASGASLAQPTPGGSTAAGGLCYNGNLTQVVPLNSFYGAGKSGDGLLSRPSGGGGAAGGYAFGGGGQGAVSAVGTVASGAGGGGGGTLINSSNIIGVVNEINLKAAAGAALPPIAQDGDYVGGAGKSGSGANILGTAGGDGGPGLVVIYFLYN